MVEREALQGKDGVEQVGSQVGSGPGGGLPG